MHILITGGTGFLGSYLAKEFIRDNQITIIKRSFSNTDRIKEILSRVRIHNIDQRELSTLFKNNQFDLIFHTATDYFRSHDQLSKLISTNINFPLELLDLAIRNRVKSFWNFGTSLPKNSNEYSLSKNQFQDWLQFKSKEISSFNLILEHFYGPEDGSEKFIEKMICSLSREEGEQDLTEGTQERDFIFIEDLIDAVRTIFNSFMRGKIENGEFHIGSGENHSIKSVVCLIHSILDSKVKLNFGNIKSNDISNFNSSADLTEITKLGWSPKTSLSEGIKKTISTRINQA